MNHYEEKPPVSKEKLQKLQELVQKMDRAETKLWSSISRLQNLEATLTVLQEAEALIIEATKRFAKKTSNSRCNNSNTNSNSSNCNKIEHNNLSTKKLSISNNSSSSNNECNTKSHSNTSESQLQPLSKTCLTVALKPCQTTGTDVKLSVADCQKETSKYHEKKPEIVQNETFETAVESCQILHVTEKTLNPAGCGIKRENESKEKSSKKMREMNSTSGHVTQADGASVMTPKTASCNFAPKRKLKTRPVENQMCGQRIPTVVNSQTSYDSHVPYSTIVTPAVVKGNLKYPAVTQRQCALLPSSVNNPFVGKQMPYPFPVHIPNSSHNGTTIRRSSVPYPPPLIPPRVPPLIPPINYNTGFVQPQPLPIPSLLNRSPNFT